MSNLPLIRAGGVCSSIAALNFVIEVITHQPMLSSLTSTLNHVANLSESQPAMGFTIKYATATARVTSETPDSWIP